MVLIRSISIVGFFTLMSRITGLVREVLVAHYLGAGLVTDCFNVAWKLPNMFRRLFAEGALSSAFIPLFSETLEHDGKREARLFASRVLSFTGLILGILCALMILFMPWVMYAFAPGFSGAPGKHDLAVELARITFVYLFFISICALFAGILNALGRFAAGAVAPVLLNVVSMVGLVGLISVTPTPGHALAWGVACAGVAQVVWLGITLWRRGFLPRFVRPVASPRVRLLLARMMPVAFGAGLYQIGLVVDVMLASFLQQGSISWLNFADRINQLPLGVVGIAVGTALLPLLSRHIAAGDTVAALESQNRGVEFSLLLTLPAAVGLVALAFPIVSVIYERGAFTAEDTQATAMALMAFSVGLPAYVLVKVFLPGFFARGDTRTPFRIAALSLGVNVVLSVVLMQFLGHVGLALSTACASVVNAGCLMFVLAQRGQYAMDARFKQRLPRTVTATCCMGGALYGIHFLLASAFVFEVWVTLFLKITGGAVTFLVSAILLGAVTRDDLRLFGTRRSHEEP